MPISTRHKQAIRRWVPQGLRDCYNRFSGHAIYYDGVFSSWSEAESAAASYASDLLFQRLESAALAVRSGEAAWEQDGVTHGEISPDLPQLACLAIAALSNAGKLEVLDIGGGFGSSFHQALAFLHPECLGRWHIVEQPHLVASGRQDFETQQLRFHGSIEECLAVATPNVALLSSVLQYVPDPRSLLRSIADAGIDCIIIDRHPISFTRELITVQRIPPSLYQASYASWLFDANMTALLSAGYQKVMEWEGKDPPIRGRGIGARFVGEFWRRSDR